MRARNIGGCLKNRVHVLSGEGEDMAAKHCTQPAGAFPKTHFAYPMVVLVCLAISFSAESGELGSPLESAEKTKSAYVYVIDTSSSMRWIFDDVKETVEKAVRKSCAGDSLSVILFGDKVTTLVSYKSINDSKKQLLCSLLRTAHPNSVYTNLGLALRRGTEYLYEFFRDNTADNYIMILVTDGKDHPPPDYVRDYTIEQAMTQFPNFLPGHQWSLRYVVLKGQIDPELLSIVERYGGDFFDVENIAKVSEMTEKQVVESIIEDSESWKYLNALILDHDGEVKVKRYGQESWRTIPETGIQTVSGGDRVAVSPGSKARLSFGPIGQVGLKENTDIVLEKFQAMPSKKATSIKLKLEKGAIWNAVNTKKDDSAEYEILTPIALTGIRGTVFRLSFEPQLLKQSIAVVEGVVETSSVEEEPPYRNVTLSKGYYSEIVAGGQPSPPMPIPAEILREWARWIKSLIWGNPFSRINFNTVFITASTQKIVMGPMKPGKRYVERFAIVFSEEYLGKEKVVPEFAISLPAGTEITGAVVDVENNPLEKMVVVTLNSPTFLRYTGSSEYTGKIRLRCGDPDIKFKRDYVDLQILHSPPGFADLARGLPPITKILILSTTSLVALASATLVWRKRKTLLKWEISVFHAMRDKLVKTKLLHLLRARPIGQVLLRAGSAEGTVRVFDLSLISQTTRAVVLGIGADSSNSIRLSHESIRPFHCAIWASRTRNPTKIYIESRSDGYLAVNGETVPKVRQLKDEDEITIGQCTLQFFDTQFRRQVKVHMDDGSIYEGILDYWDLSHSVFYMTQVSGEKENFLTIRFAEVSYVQFYKDQSERRKLWKGKRKRRKPVKVILTNGNILTGFVHKKYRHEGARGLFLWPFSEESKMQCTYIPKSSIEGIVSYKPAEVSGLPTGS